MTFEEAAQRYQQLQQAYAAGQISWPDLQAQVQQLSVSDAAGNWWRLDPQSGQWLMWNGQTWAPSAQPAQPAAVAEVELPVTGKWTQRLGDILAIAGSCALAYGMYYYSTLDKMARPDTTTPILMVALPLALILLRRPLDGLLRPLQGVRRKLPPLLLVGIGLGIPFLVAKALYPRFTQFEYLRRSYVISILLSYAVLRTPAPLPQPGGQRR